MSEDQTGGRHLIVLSRNILCHKHPKKAPWDGTKKKEGMSEDRTGGRCLIFGITSAQKWQMGKTGFLALQAPTYSSLEYKKWFFWNCNKDPVAPAKQHQNVSQAPKNHSLRLRETPFVCEQTKNCVSAC